MSRFTVSSRSKWKGAYSKIRLITYDYIMSLRRLQGAKSIFKYTSRNLLNKMRRTKSRASVVLPQHLGVKHSLTTGVKYSSVRVTTDHINHRFGEFNQTTRRGNVIHKNNKKTKKLKNKK